MHQIIRPQVMPPTISAAIQEPFHRWMIRAVWSVIPGSLGR
jgi:hypothetical protein